MDASNQNNEDDNLNGGLSFFVSQAMAGPDCASSLELLPQRERKIYLSSSSALKLSLFNFPRTSCAQIRKGAFFICCDMSLPRWLKLKG